MKEEFTPKDINGITIEPGSTVEIHPGIDCDCNTCRLSKTGIVVGIRSTYQDRIHVQLGERKAAGHPTLSGPSEYFRVIQEQPQ